MLFDFLEEINTLTSARKIDTVIVKRFYDKLKTKKFIRATDPVEHICAFFLPVNTTSSSVYIGHHIKADDWIPPGGHIEKEETPRIAIKREFEEELGYRLAWEKIELIDMSIIDVTNPKRPCKVHFDLWYVVYIDKIPFHFDRSEFHEARWMEIGEAKKMVKRPGYDTIIKKVERLFHS